MHFPFNVRTCCAIGFGQFNVSAIVPVCCSDPEVAVTVTVALIG
jgi:hypothetical protein